MSNTTDAAFSAERAMLGTRDRDELHEIASAMGVRGATRLRKADLIEAILAKATGGADGIPEPTGEKPKRARGTKRKAAEEAAEANGEGLQQLAGAGATPAGAEAESAVEEVRAEAAPAPAAEPPSAPQASEAAPAPAETEQEGGVQRFRFGTFTRSAPPEEAAASGGTTAAEPTVTVEPPGELASAAG